jgi:hypothetical protein
MLCVKGVEHLIPELCLLPAWRVGGKPTVSRMKFEAWIHIVLRNEPGEMTLIFRLTLLAASSCTERRLDSCLGACQSQILSLSRRCMLL